MHLFTFYSASNYLTRITGINIKKRKRKKREGEREKGGGKKEKNERKVEKDEQKTSARATGRSALP